MPVTNERLPRILLLSGLLSLALYAGYDHWGELPMALGLVRARPSAPLNAAILLSLLWMTYIPAVLWVARTPPATRTEDRWALAWVIALAVLFRIVLLPGEPEISSDFYRYLWDGRVFHAGVNPYAFPPTAQALAPLRFDSLHLHLNRPDVPGFYPPLAEWVFRAVDAFHPNVVGLKFAFFSFEAFGAGALLVLLRRVGRPLSQSLVYLWNPLIVVELTRGGHSDAIMLPWLLFALFFRMNGRMAAAGVALGFATLARLYPIVCLFALIRRARPGERRLFGFEPALPIAFGMTLLAGYLPFLRMEGGVLGNVPGYLASDWEEFNAGIRIVLRYTLAWAMGVDDPWRYSATAGQILAAGFLVYCGRVALRREEGDQTLRRTIAVLGGWLLLVTPSVEPWYAWGLVALAAVTLSPAWIWFSGAAGLSYLKYVARPSLVPTWVLIIEFLPTLAFLAYETGKAPASDHTPPSTGELVPQPLPERRQTLVPLYVIGMFPVIAILIVLIFFFGGFAG